MAKKKGKNPEALADEALDKAAGGLNFTKQGPGAASFPGYTGGVYVAAGDVNSGDPALKIADGSVKPGS